MFKFPRKTTIHLIKQRTVWLPNSSVSGQGTKLVAPSFCRWNHVFENLKYHSGGSVVEHSLREREVLGSIPDRVKLKAL